jgi:hypothetical protein
MENRSWISVHKQRPKIEEKVIIAILCPYTNSAWGWDIRMSYLRKDGAWQAEDGYTYNKPEYWMPLPPPPEFTKEQIWKSDTAKRKGEEYEN